jgi:16S rRNA (cytidine1402-2'-O)-methyltransferase
LVFFEAPHRILKTLGEMRSVFGDRPISVARELTKLHQQVIQGDVEHIIGQLTNTRGEFTVVIGPTIAASASAENEPDQFIYDEFCHMADSGLGRRAAITALAEKYGRTTKQVYSAIELVKKSAES